MGGRLSVGKEGAAATGFKLLKSRIGSQIWFGSHHYYWVASPLQTSLMLLPLHILSVVSVGMHLFSLPFDLFIRSPC